MVEAGISGRFVTENVTAGASDPLASGLGAGASRAGFTTYGIGRVGIEPTTLGLKENRRTTSASRTATPNRQAFTPERQPSQSVTPPALAARTDSPAGSRGPETVGIVTESVTDETLQVCERCGRGDRCERCKHCDTLLCSECLSNPCDFDPSNPDADGESPQGVGAAC